jgi:hypothetical protein
MFKAFKFRAQAILSLLEKKHPGLHNTAEKRLRMHQIMKIWRGI